MTEYEIKRNNFVKPFVHDEVQAKLIPAIAAELFYREFGITIEDPEHTVPIVFSVGWKHILNFVKSQPSPEFAINICGLSLEYVTEYSESDKPTNIVPQMVHKKKPIFVEHEHRNTTASSINEELLNSYNQWRSVNLTEVLDKIEQETENDIRTNYGIYLMHAAAVIPMLAAAYAAGLQIATETNKTVNMYHLFEIDVYAEDGAITVTPLAAIKQSLKDDDKK